MPSFMVTANTIAALMIEMVVGMHSEPDPSSIYGGEPVDRCGWPSAVFLSTPGGGNCTGTLVHPSIVITAAHCVIDGVASRVRFGERVEIAYELAGTEYCRPGPDWDGTVNEGADYAYCKLSDPVTSVPVIPVAAGCEQAAIVPGARIMQVGFGVDEDGGVGRKKMLDTVISAVTAEGELISGAIDEIICNGDSGGPTFVYLDPDDGADGSWRLAAIHSWAQGASPTDPACSGIAGSVLVSQAIEWIEQDSGIDITPCTTADRWDPTYYCGGLATEPWRGQGSYQTECTSESEVLEFSTSCGPSLAADRTPPSVEIVTPVNEEQIVANEDLVPVVIELQAEDEGWGVESVELTIRSVTAQQEEIDVRTHWQSWVWNTNLPPGSYEIEALATDLAGHGSAPVRVCFGVGQPGCDAEGLDESGGSSGSFGSGDSGEPPLGGTGAGDESGQVTQAGSSSGDASGQGESRGCGCRASDQGPRGGRLGGGWLILGLLGHRVRGRR